MSRPFTITTPIYYVNGAPHIGHAYTTTAADAIARYHRLHKRPTMFLTGVDEHGQKVLEAAEKRGMSPQAHCDDMVVRWKEMMAGFDITFDRFIRTTDADHIAVVQGALQRLHDREELYQDTYTGWYSTAAERFWTEKDLVDGKCPDTGQPVKEITETNWFFKMGSYQQRLIDHIEANPLFIQPDSRRNEMLGFLRKDLGDLCISRPIERMSWGIPLPFDDRFVTYVWFDALLNYLTGCGYDAEGSFDDSERWPASFQLLGKDILTTHAIYWSTMLMALEVPLPGTLFAHGWWTADGVKMSKSLGNTIDPFLLKDAYGLDATRHFLLSAIRFGADGSFSYTGFNTHYNDHLANDFGNLAHRALNMTTNWLGGVVPPLGALDERDTELANLGNQTYSDVDAALAKLDFQGALQAVGRLVQAGNKYIEATQPWALNKAGETERLQTVLRLCLEVCHLASLLQLWAMPTKCGELLDKLSSSPACFDRVPTAEQALGLLTEGAALIVGDPLFPRHQKLPPAIQALEDAATPAPPPKKKKKKKSKKPQPAPEITFEEFSRIALKAGTVVSATAHPDAERLLVVQVDIGEPTPRQVVAGIASLTEPDALVGQTVVVVSNLAPVELRGVRSEGMILAAGAKNIVGLVTVDAPAGETVR